MADIPETFFISEDGRWNADPIDPCMIEAVSGDVYHKLKAIVDKLPKYADTGEHFVPGHDDAWINSDDSDDPPALVIVGQSGSRSDDGDKWWFMCLDDDSDPGVYWMSDKAYSTPEAAEAAMKGGEG